jgi:hypothetical protein
MKEWRDCMEVEELNRLEYTILETLYASNSTDRYHGMTISEIMADNKGLLGARMTIYKKMKKLVKNGYLKKGITDNHADTFYVADKSINLIEGGKRA